MHRTLIALLLSLLLLTLPYVGICQDQGGVLSQNQTAINLTFLMVSNDGSGSGATGLLTSATTVVSSNTGSTSTVITAATSATVGQWLKFASGTTTAAIRSIGAWVISVSGSGPYTITLGGSTVPLPAAPVNTDTFTLSGLVCNITKNGGALAPPAGSPVETGGGRYYITGNATDANTLGTLGLQVTATVAYPRDKDWMVYAYNPLSATNLGLSNLDATISSRSTYAGADTAGTTTLLARIPTYPTNFSSFSIDGTGKVTFANTSIATVTTLTNPPADSAGVGKLVNAFTPVTGNLNDASPTVSSFIVTLSPSPSVDTISGSAVVLTSGSMLGIQRDISLYSTSTGKMFLYAPFPSTPANGTTFVVIPSSRGLGRP